MIDLLKISFTTMCYITEDINLVLQSVRNLFPEEMRDTRFNLSKMQSQFGDRLIIANRELLDEEANQVIKFIASNLSEAEKIFLDKNLESRVDQEDRIIHLRFDKFEPLKNKITLGEGSDVIKVQIKYQVFTSQQNTLENIRNSLLLVGLIQNE